jgi:hypothetical protein
VALLSPPYALGAAGQVFSGKNLRLAAGAAFRSAAAGGVQGTSGVLYGPAGAMGELTLNSNTSLTIAPFRAVVQNTQDVTQGQYLISNDAAVTATTAVTAGLPTVPAQDASQFRRAYVAAYVADSQVTGVASSATTDRAVLDILPGALAATAGAAGYPAVPANALLLGELLLPPAGQTVTVTPYNQRTTTRGGVLPVIADGGTRPGHDGAPGLFVGEPRDHPTFGLQRWTGTAWAEPSPAQVLTPSYAASYADGGGAYDGLRVYKTGVRCLLAGSFQYTGGGSAGQGTAFAFGTLPPTVTPTGITTASMVFSNGSAWMLGMSLVAADRSLTYVPITGTLTNAAAGGRVNLNHEFRSTT